MVKNRKHANGYLNKIAYHLACGNNKKVSYFFDRQTEVYGSLTGADLEYITSTRDALVLDGIGKFPE